MSKWEDSFKKNPFENSGDKMCPCSSNQGLFVPNRQLSIVVALLLFFAFSIFMTGYFLGKKKAIEQFTEKIQQEAVADHIYTTVLTTTPNENVTSDMLLVTSLDDNVATSSLMSTIEVDVVAQEQTIAENHRYYAQLIGFGTEKAAQLFVQKLAKKGIETEVKKHVSKTAKGNTSYWYQVVTAPYNNKDDLSVLVDKLAKEENIKGACIRIC